MNEHGDQFGRIYALLEEYPATSLTVSAIAREFGITRISAAKCLELLVRAATSAWNGLARRSSFAVLPEVPAPPLPELIDRLPHLAALSPSGPHDRGRPTYAVRKTARQAFRHLSWVFDVRPGSSTPFAR